MHARARQRRSPDHKIVGLTSDLPCSRFSNSSAIGVQNHFFIEIYISAQRVLHFCFFHNLPFPRRKIRGITWMTRTPSGVQIPTISSSNPLWSVPTQRKRSGSTPSAKRASGSQLAMTSRTLRLPIRCLRADCEKSISMGHT